MNRRQGGRRRFLRRMLTLSAASLLAGCDSLSRTQWFPRFLGGAENVTRKVQHTFVPRRALAEEFPASQISRPFPANGTIEPDGERYRRLARTRFVDWRLQVGGLVAHPATYSLAELRAMPARTQITRHDCVEGWSAIGKWTGVPLSDLLMRANPKSEARYVVFHCVDTMDDGLPYYESIDLPDAFHPQTLLAYDLDDAPLPIANGAPLRLRVERQLGYKMAKYLMRIELVESYAHIAGGKGGYWEDQGYEWYAGI